MSNVAYNMDCMEAMRQMPDNAFDKAFCDKKHGSLDMVINEDGIINSIYKISSEIHDPVKIGLDEVKKALLNTSVNAHKMPQD